MEPEIVGGASCAFAATRLATSFDPVMHAPVEMSAAAGCP
jgi:hypothetical protein